MKIIDEKGKLFGKINVIDLLVFAFLLCLIPMFYFGYKFLTAKPVELKEEEFIVIERDFKFIKLKPEVLKAISVGDKELDENGEVRAEIISLGQSAPYKYKFNIGGEELIKEATILKQMDAKLKLKAEIKQSKLYYKDKEIKIASVLEFDTNKYSLHFSVIPHKEKKERIIDLPVIIKDLDEDLLKKISVGDKEVDENGQTIAEILSLGKVEDSYLEVSLGGGNFAMGNISNKRQISAEMRLKCQIAEGNQLYFKGKKIGYNKAFEFKTDKYKVATLVGKAFGLISPLKKRWISLRVKFSGVSPEIASLVQKGNVEKDPTKKTVVRISSIISNKPSQVLLLKENEFITLNHPFNRDILLFLDAQCIEKEGVYYFKNYPVKMGNNITFATDLYSITGEIIGMEMK